MMKKLSFRTAVRRIGAMKTVTRIITETVTAGSADGTVVPAEAAPLVQRAREVSNDSVQVDEALETYRRACEKMEVLFGHPFSIAAAKTWQEMAELAVKAKKWEAAIEGFEASREAYEVSGSGPQDGHQLHIVVKQAANAYAQLVSSPEYKEPEKKELRRAYAEKGLRLATRALSTMTNAASGEVEERMMLQPLVGLSQLASVCERGDIALRSLNRNLDIKKKLKLGNPNDQIEKARQQIQTKLNSLDKEGRQAASQGWEREDFEEEEHVVRTKLINEQHRARIAFIVLFRGILKVRELNEEGANPLNAIETFRLFCRIGGAATKARMPVEAHHYFSEACDLVDETNEEEIKDITFEEKRAARASLAFSLCTMAQTEHEKGSAAYRQLMSAAAPHYDRALSMAEDEIVKKRATGSMTAADELSQCNLILQLGVVAANLEFQDYALQQFHRVKHLHEKHKQDTATEDRYIALLEKLLARKQQQLLESCARKALDDKSTAIPPSDPTIQGVRALIADGQMSLNEKRYEDAEQSLKLAVAMLDVLGRHDIELRTGFEYRTAISTLGALNYEWAMKNGDPRSDEFRRRNELALSYFRLTLSILKDQLGSEEHPNCQATHFNLGCVYYNLEYYTPAVYHFTLAKGLRQKLGQSTDMPDRNLAVIRSTLGIRFMTDALLLSGYLDENGWPKNLKKNHFSGSLYGSKKPQWLTNGPEIELLPSAFAAEESLRRQSNHKRNAVVEEEAQERLALAGIFVPLTEELDRAEIIREADDDFNMYCDELKTGAEFHEEARHRHSIVAEEHQIWRGIVSEEHQLWKAIFFKEQRVDEFSRETSARDAVLEEESYAFSAISNEAKYGHDGLTQVFLAAEEAAARVGIIGEEPVAFHEVVSEPFSRFFVEVSEASAFSSLQADENLRFVFAYAADFYLELATVAEILNRSCILAYQTTAWSLLQKSLTVTGKNILLVEDESIWRDLIIRQSNEGPDAQILICFHDQMNERRALFDAWEAEFKSYETDRDVIRAEVHSAATMNAKESVRRKDVLFRYWVGLQTLVEEMESDQRKYIAHCYYYCPEMELIRFNVAWVRSRQLLQQEEALQCTELEGRSFWHETSLNVYRWAWYESFDAVYETHLLKLHSEELLERLYIEKVVHHTLLQLYQFEVFLTDMIIREETIRRVTDVLRDERRQRNMLELAFQMKVPSSTGIHSQNPFDFNPTLPGTPKHSTASTVGSPLGSSTGQLDLTKLSAAEVARQPMFHKRGSALAQGIATRNAKRRQIAMAAADELMLTEALALPTFHELLDDENSKSVLGKSVAFLRGTMLGLPLMGGASTFGERHPSDAAPPKTVLLSPRGSNDGSLMPRNPTSAAYQTYAVSKAQQQRVGVGFTGRRRETIFTDFRARRHNQADNPVTWGKPSRSDSEQELKPRQSAVGFRSPTSVPISPRRASDDDSEQNSSKTSSGTSSPSAHFFSPFSSQPNSRKGSIFDAIPGEFVTNTMSLAQHRRSTFAESGTDFQRRAIGQVYALKLNRIETHEAYNRDQLWWRLYHPGIVKIFVESSLHLHACLMTELLEEYIAELDELIFSLLMQSVSDPLFAMGSDVEDNAGHDDHSARTLAVA